MPTLVERPGVPGLGIEVESEGCDYAVAFAPDENDPNGIVILCENEEAARETASMTGGKLVARDVWVSAWAEVEDK